MNICRLLIYIFIEISQITELNSNLKLSLKKNSLDSKDANDYREQGIYNIGNTDSSWSNLPTGVTTVIIVVIENYRRTQLLLANNGIYYRYIANPNLSFEGVLWEMLSAKNYTIKYPTDMFSESQCLCERSGNVITVYVSLKASKDISSGTVISLTGTPNTPKSQYFSVLSGGGNIVSVRTYSVNIEFSVNATIKTDTWIRFQLTYVCTN